MIRKEIKKQSYIPATSSKEITMEAIFSIDDRGQMVIPKEIREKMDLHRGSKLALVTKEQDGKLCCIFFFKSEELAETVQKKLRPKQRESS